MGRRSDAAVLVALLVAFVAVGVWGHADARFAGVDAAVTDPTCTNGNVSAFTLRVTNERPTPVGFTVGIRLVSVRFWPNADGQLRTRVPASTTTDVRLVAPGSDQRVPITSYDYGTPRNRSRVVVTLYDGKDRLDIPGRLSCGGFRRF